MSNCPFCGVATEVPHETQEACIAALNVEIARVKELIERVHPPDMPPFDDVKDHTEHPSIWPEGV